MLEYEKTHEAVRAISIHEAKPDDAVGIAEVQTITWLNTYPNDEYGIAKSDIEERVNQWCSEESINKLRDSIAHTEECTLRLVAKDGDKIVGHCLVVKKAPYNKLQVLYVLPDYQGRGVGTLLARQGMEWLGTERNIALEVVSYNTDSIEFYKKLGFEITGNTHNEVTELPSGKVIPEFQMIKHIAT